MLIHVHKNLWKNIKNVYIYIYIYIYNTGLKEIEISIKLLQRIVLT